MSERSGSTPGEACRRLVALIEAQAGALEDGDFGRFEALTAERVELHALIAQTPAGAFDARSRSVLNAVAELDRRTISRARDLLAATATELGQLRRGRAAVGGYGRPGLHVRARATVLDRTS